MALAPGIFTNALLYGVLLSMMATGLTLTYLTTKIPNFAHGNFVTLGAYLGYILFKFYNVNPYYSIPLTAVVCGAVAVFVYRVVLRPLANRGAPTIALMIVTLAINLLFIGFFGIIGDVLTNVYRFGDADFFLLSRLDFSMSGISGVMIVSLVCLIGTVVSIYLLLSKTNFGLAMTASVEKPSLAETIGIKVDRVYTISWLIGGALAGLAGSLIVFYLPVGPNFANSFIISIFAASILGGLTSIYGAVVGGMVIGTSQIVVTSYLGSILGPWVLSYQAAVPILIMVGVLLFLPAGITSISLSKGVAKRKT